jgi:hypothetical protein
VPHGAMHDCIRSHFTQASAEDVPQCVEGGNCGTPALLKVARQAVLTVEIGRPGKIGLGKTYVLPEPCSPFHTFRTSQAYSDKEIGSADPGVFTSLSKRMSLLSKSTWFQRSEKPSLYVRPPV